MKSVRHTVTVGRSYRSCRVPEHGNCTGLMRREKSLRRSDTDRSCILDISWNKSTKNWDENDVAQKEEKNGGQERLKRIYSQRQNLFYQSLWYCQYSNH